MRIGVVALPGPNAQYRAVEPARALARRGHEVVWPPETGEADVARLMGCDVVHVYRGADRRTRTAVEELSRQGVGVTYDNDDDYTAVPKESPRYRQHGGFAGQRMYAETVKMARLADVFTTTTLTLADRYVASGVKRVEVIPNQLTPHVDRPRSVHAGVVVGWVAAMEHLTEVARLPIRAALERVVSEHDGVHVVSIGVNLGLTKRYTHVEEAAFHDLPRHIGRFDVGIAPLADVPCNWARSDIKVKEYAASGTPWLASPVGPYVGLGEAQGGRLVADDEWYDGLARLVTSARDRRRLARRGKRWAKDQTVDAVVGQWEKTFATAADRASERLEAAGTRS
jgi:glycosyltransferase involved in cell wall biosynthesis